MSETEAEEKEIVETEKEVAAETPTEETLAPVEESEIAEEPVEETVPAAETKEEEPEEGEEEIEVVEERVYTIPLRHAWVVTPRGKRSPRAVRDVRDFIARHMKAEEVSMSNDINSAVWARGINKPPRKVKVRAVKDKEGKVIVYPAKA